MNAKELKTELMQKSFDSKSYKKYIEEDFKSTITASANAVFTMLNNVKKNKQKINYVVNRLEEAIEDNNNYDKLNFISKKLNDIIIRISKHSQKNNKEIKVVYLKLKELDLQVKNKIKNVSVDETTALIEKIIYEEKDLNKLSKIFNRQKDIFKEYKRKEMFKELLLKFVNAYDKNETLYYYKVISLILQSPSRTHIVCEKEKFVYILLKSKKELSKNIIDKFYKDYTITNEDLEIRHDIKFSFSLKINEMYNYKVPNTNHTDFTKYPSITIDDEGNICNDDGLSISPNYDGTYTLRIDISSIPALIPFNSYVDRQAYKRVETIYTMNGEIPTYPQYIAFNKGSLLENTYRYVISYIYRIDTNFDVIHDSLKIEAGLIKVSNNLSYTQADILLEKDYNDPLSTNLKILSQVASKIDNPNSSAGIVNSDKMVQKFMALPNKDVSKLFKEQGYPFIYRAHKKLDEKDKSQLRKQYSDITMKSNLCKSIIKIIETSMEEGIYTNMPQVHQALGFDVYGNLTKPLRNYPSALNEYMIYDFIINNKNDNKTLYKWESILKEMTPYINERIRLNKLFIKEYDYLVSKDKIRKK